MSFLEFLVVRAARPDTSPWVIPHAWSSSLYMNWLGCYSILPSILWPARLPATWFFLSINLHSYIIINAVLLALRRLTMKCIGTVVAHFRISLHEAGPSILKHFIIIDFSELPLKYRNTLPVHFLYRLQLIFSRVRINERILSQQLPIAHKTIATLTCTDHFSSKWILLVDGSAALLPSNLTATSNQPNFHLRWEHSRVQWSHHRGNRFWSC